MKKLITLLVTIAMIGVMLTGCGGSGKEVTSSTVMSRMPRVGMFWG